MKRVEMEADQMPGQDSFLDVITNIVGILILLVLVVGLRTSKAVHNAPNVVAAASVVDAHEKLQEAYNGALTSELQVRDLAKRVGGAAGEVPFREAERAYVSTAGASAEHEIADRRAKLSTTGQRDFDVRRQLNDAQLKLDELTREQIARVSQEPASNPLECQPTPLSKFVRGREIHVLL